LVQVETDAGPVELLLEKVATLGRGRGARVDLMRDLRRGRLIAEKVFRTGWGVSSLLTHALYRGCFQSPFPYRTTVRAVWAAFYRRKAIRLLTEYWFGEPRVADALYVRWDGVENTFVLGTEYIDGRGPRVSSPDPDAPRPWPRLRPPQDARDEMSELIAFMDRLRAHLGESGFVGAQWQVDPGTLVATANFLRQQGRWIAVDLESGVPAVTMPRYVWQGLRLGRLPLFDDTDFAAAWSYHNRHTEPLTRRLGPAKAGYLRYALKELEVQERLWKAGEVALLREPSRWTLAERRDHVRRHTLDRWLQEARISPEAASQAAASTARFLAHGLFGGMIDRARRWSRFLRDPEHRASVVSPHVAAWVREGRMDPETGSRLLTHPHLLPLTAQAFAGLLPLPVLRFLRERQYRVEALTCAYRALVDERYQCSLAEQFILRRIEAWETLHGLSAEESQRLRNAVATPSAQEYIRGFGVHLALKALLPSLLLDPLFVGVALAAGSVYPLALMFTRSLAITGYTLVRWIKRSELRFGTAFALGLIPKVGVLAYPGQLLTVHPELASFLVRDLAARMAERLPIYGGRYTLTQHYAIRCGDLLVSLGDALMRMLRRAPRATPSTR
jgi:hypothetical protein